MPWVQRHQLADPGRVIRQIGEWYQTDDEGEETEEEVYHDAVVVTLLLRADEDQMDLRSVLRDDYTLTEWVFPDGDGRATVLGQSEIRGNDAPMALAEWMDGTRNAVRDLANVTVAATNPSFTGAPDQSLVHYERWTRGLGLPQQMVGADYISPSTSHPVQYNEAVREAQLMWPVVRERPSVGVLLHSLTTNASQNQWHRLMMTWGARSHDYQVAVTPPNRAHLEQYGPFVAAAWENMYFYFRFAATNAPLYRWSRADGWEWRNVSGSSPFQSMPAHRMICTTNGASPGPLFNLDGRERTREIDVNRPSMRLGARLEQIPDTTDTPLQPRRTTTGMTAQYIRMDDEVVEPDDEVVGTPGRSIFWGGGTDAG